MWAASARCSHGSIHILLLFAVITLCENVATIGVKRSSDDAYGIVIDAGSSGSRIYVFRWKPSEHNKKEGVLPQIDEIYRYKIKPGLSSFVDDKQGLNNHIESLLSNCKNKVPSEKHATTPIYLMATAGMRLLLERKANTIFEEINEIFQKKSVNPFLYAAANSRILSGEEEGVFAWIAVNYLRKFFSKGAYESVGILEMGGASTQITFIPDGSILAFKFPVLVAGRRYSLYSHSYLYYGQEKVSERVRQILYRMPQHENATRINDPCQLVGHSYSDNKIDPSKTVEYVGSGDSDACLEIIHVFVYKAPYNRCYPKPCAIGPAYQPTVGTDKAFYALGAFGKNIAPRGILDEHSRFQPSHLLSVSREYCKQTVAEVRNQTGRTDPFVSVECLMGLYIPRLLTVGYGFSANTTRIIATDTIVTRKAHWPLGAMIYELEKDDALCTSMGVMGASTSGSSHLGHLPLLTAIVCLLTKILA